MDYDTQTITFHTLNQDKEVVTGIVDPSLVIATLTFIPTGVDGKMPEVELRIGYMQPPPHILTLATSVAWN